MLIRVKSTDIRARLTALLGAVEHGGQKVILLRHGKEVAALVSMADLKRIWEAEDEELYGPRDAKTGRRRGRALILLRSVTGWRRGGGETGD